MSLGSRPSFLKQIFFIPGPLPGMNDFISTGSRFIYNTQKQRWMQTIGWEIVRQKLLPMERVHIQFIWQEKNTRRDPDNIAGIGKKFILDALVKGGILKNDGWKQIDGWSDAWVVVPNNPGVTVVMETRA